jgi:hypothetical protein
MDEVMQQRIQFAEPSLSRCVAEKSNPRGDQARARD